MAIGNNSIHSCLKQFVESKFVKHAAFIFMVVVILFLSVWARAFIGSMKNFDQGEEYFYKQQYIKAITFFDRSMHWYAPLNPYIKRSAEYLWEISNQADQINDEQLSLIALETIRDSFFSSRSFYSPGTIWIERSESRIRNIVNNQKGLILQGNDGYGEDAIDTSSIEYNDPNIFWTIVLEIGLFCWIGSVIGFIYFFLGSDNKDNRYVCTYWFWILVAGVNYGLWILGMVKA
ncbi:hypothetical protein OAC89_00365 [Deltaproteobacteria bacterium]|nr:hypothetical protein [Deltaproteobacteria bacterium]